MEKLKRKFILWIMSGKLYKFLMDHVLWRIRFTTYYPEFPAKYLYEASEVIQPADVVLCTDDLKLTSFLIPGNIGADHAALCTSKIGYKVTLIEATHRGVKPCQLAETWKESTRLILMRCLKWDEEYKLDVIERALGLEGMPYDINFHNPQAIYCSELIAISDYLEKANFDWSDLAGLGISYLSPTGILLSYDFICVYDSKGEYTGLTGDQIEKRISNAK